MRLAHRRRLILLVVAGLALLLLLSVGLYGLLAGRSSADEPEPPAHDRSTFSRSALHVARPRPVLGTSDPETFARSVAGALFTWDTRHGPDPSEWEQAVVNAADAGEAVTVAADVRRYLPAPNVWKQLAAYGTRQRFELQSVRVPISWPTALEQAGPGQIPSGAAALTVEGIRYREGTWKTQLTRTTHDVSFTVFAVCPREQSCALLRLSLPDRPLK